MSGGFNNKSNNAAGSLTAAEVLLIQTIEATGYFYSANGQFKIYVTVGFNNADYLISDYTSAGLAIQAAIDAVYAAGGGTVYVKSNVSPYLTETSLIMKDNVTLMGDKNSTIIKRSNTDTTHLVFNFDGVSNFSIKNLTIDANETATIDLRRTLKITNCSDFSIEDLVIKNVSKESLFLDTCSKFYVNKVDSYSAIQESTADGFSVYSCHEFFIDKVYFECGDDGIGIISSYDALITNVIRKNPVTGGAVKFGSAGLAVDNHDIIVDNVLDYGITGAGFGGLTVNFLGSLSGTQLHTMYNITCTNLTGVGNRGVVRFAGSSSLQDGVTFSFQDIIIKNVVGINCNQPPIIHEDTYGVKGLLIDGIKLTTNLDQRLIRLNQGKDVVIKNFVLRDCPSNGVFIGNPSTGLPDNITFQDGTIENSGLGGSATGFVVSSGTGALNLHLKNITIKGSTAAGLNYSTRNNVIDIEDCHFNDNGTYGVDNIESYNVRVKNTEFKGNTTAPIKYVTNELSNNYGSDVEEPILVDMQSKGGVQQNINGAAGDTPRTTSGWLENENFHWYITQEATAMSAEYDSAITRTGRFTLKLSTTDVTGKVTADYNDCGGGTTISSGDVHDLIPLKPSTKYRLSCWVKTNNVVTATINIRVYNSLYARTSSNTATSIVGTNDWTLSIVEFTSGSDDLYGYIRLGVQTAGNISDAWFDVNSVKVEEIVELSINYMSTPSFMTVQTKAVSVGSNKTDGMTAVVNGVKNSVNGGVGFTDGTIENNFVSGLVYPFTENKYSKTKKIPSVATRIYFRLAKYENTVGVVMPAIEFTDGSGVYIDHLLLDIDNYGDSNPAVNILSNTTNWQQSGTGTSEGTTGYGLNNGEYMTFTSTADDFLVEFVIGKGTTNFTNITKNRVYLSSNSTNADSTIDPSSTMNVALGIVQQNEVHTIRDIQERLISSVIFVPIISSGSGVPTTTPDKIGDIYVDTTNFKFYTAKGTSSSADWIANTQVKTGAISKIAAVGGKIKEFYTDVGNVGTGEDDLYTYTTEASILGINGDMFEFDFGGVYVTSATATRQIKLWFGGTAIFDTGALTLSLSSSWNIYGIIIRVSATVVRYTISLTTQGAALSAYTASGELTGLTLSNTNVLKMTGEAAGVGAATNDIVAKIGAVRWYPASV